MSTKRIRAKADELVGYGYSRQHLYDTLVLEFPDATPERVAGVVRYVPSEAARAEYAAVHQGMLLVIGLTALMHLVDRWAGMASGADTILSLLRALPFASLFLGVALFRWRGEVLPLLVVVNGAGALGLFGDVGELMIGALPWTSLVMHGLALATALLAWHLYRKVFGKAEAITDPTGIKPTTYLFPPEPGIHRI